MPKKMQNNIRLQDGKELCLSNMKVREYDGAYYFEKPFIRYVTKRLNLPYPISRIINKLTYQHVEPTEKGYQTVVTELQAKLNQVLGEKVPSIIDVIDYDTFFDRNQMVFIIDLTIEEQHMSKMSNSIGHYIED